MRPDRILTLQVQRASVQPTPSQTSPFHKTEALFFPNLNLTEAQKHVLHRYFLPLTEKEARLERMSHLPKIT